MECVACLCLCHLVRLHFGCLGWGVHHLLLINAKHGDLLSLCTCVKSCLLVDRLLRKMGMCKNLGGCQ